MSIINDALKKTQSAFSKKEYTAPSAHEFIIAKQRTPMRIQNKRMIFFILTACILTVCTLTWHTFLLSLVHSHHTISSKNQQILLNGTLQTASTHAAFINHKLYHVGDVVDGYQIKQISYNGVVLFNPLTHHTRSLTVTLRS